jgi:hypothetical protein
MNQIQKYSRILRRRTIHERRRQAHDLTQEVRSFTLSGASSHKERSVDGSIIGEVNTIATVSPRKHTAEVLETMFVQGGHEEVDVEKLKRVDLDAAAAELENFGKRLEDFKKDRQK